MVRSFLIYKMPIDLYITVLCGLGMNIFSFEFGIMQRAYPLSAEDLSLKTLPPGVNFCYNLQPTIKQLTKLLAAILLWLAVCHPVTAHEFWILPGSFEPKADTSINLNLYVGQFFEGEMIPLSLEYVTVFSHFSRRGQEDFTTRLPHASKTGIKIPGIDAGSHLIAIDTHPNRVELSADKFYYYLRDEGLEEIIAMRESAGKSTMPSRERYRRHIKTLISVNGESDDTALIRTGQRLEILPVSNPFFKQGGDILNFRLLFDDKPLAKALVKAWHKQDGQTTLIRVRSNEEGLVRLMLPFAGTWMLSTVHMLPVTDDPAFDWESFWGNLTFQLDTTENK